MGTVWDATGVTSFQTVAAVLGGLLMLGALLSGLARRSILSLAAVFVLAGFMLGHGATGVLDFSASSGFVTDLASVALIVILFRDGLEVDAELLQSRWQLPLRKLAIAMPMTAIVVALVTHLLIGLTWTESFLLGALLSPTDPVLSSGVVTDPRVPHVVRHSLNLESGLNDGLALPAVLAFAAALEPAHGNFVWWHFVLQDVGPRSGLRHRLRAARLGADAEGLRRARRRADPGASARPLRSRSGLRDLRCDRAARRTATASSRCSSRRS